MIDHKINAIEIFMEMRVVVLNAFAKSHAIKIGKNKRATIENILNRCDTYTVELRAVPGKDIRLSMRFTLS